MKVSEIVYMCLDLAKSSTSDDSFYTAEHVLSLCKHYRAFLIKKEQEKNKGTETTASEFEQQQICFDLEKMPAIDGEPCTGGYYLRTTTPIPKVLEGTQPQVYPIDFYQGTHISYISRNRMRYLGSNPYMGNITYASIGPDLHLYLHSSNPQFMYLKKLRMCAVFEDFDEVTGLMCDGNGDSVACDVLDAEFPIRKHLVAPLIELVVKQLTGSVYKPIDKRNDANDNLMEVRQG